jgi:hypothetical protein
LDDLFDYHEQKCVQLYAKVEALTEEIETLGKNIVKVELAAAALKK